MKKYDAIIIGAGNGGLSAAAMLAHSGKSVAVFEKSPTPGGVATSFRRGRFEFEVSLHELCGFGRYDKPFGSVRKMFDTLGISDRIKWVDIPEAYRIITTDGDRIDAVMPFNIPDFIEAMERYAPGSGKAASKVFDLAADYLKALGELGSAKNDEERIAALKNNRDFLHTCTMTVDEGLKACGLVGKAADIFKGYWAYLCVDTGRLSFMHYLTMVNSYIELRSVIPENRSREMTLALSGYIEENGGDIFLNTTVDKILIDNGKAIGVRTEGEKEYLADDIVCDLSAHTVYSTLIDEKHLSEDDKKKTNARNLSGRGFCVYLGLNKSAEELGLENYSYFIYPDMDTAKQYSLMASPETNRVQNTVCLNAASPKASPEGTCIITMTTLFTSDWWDRVSEKDYQAQKYSFAASMIDTFEKATGVKISEYIEENEISTPVTFARYMNSPGGAIYGYRGDFTDSSFQRKMMDKHYSSIKSLHFTGGFASSMNGYSSSFSSGRDVGGLIIREAGK